MFGQATLIIGKEPRRTGNGGVPKVVDPATDEAIAGLSRGGPPKRRKQCLPRLDGATHDRRGLDLDLGAPCPARFRKVFASDMSGQAHRKRRQGSGG